MFWTTWDSPMDLIVVVLATVGRSLFVELVPLDLVMFEDRLELL